MATWNSEQTLLLIQLYKQLNCGYMVSREQYKTTLLSIADKLGKIRPGTTINDVKQKIKTLRTQYAKEKANVKAYQAEKKAYKPKLWCYDILKFLDDIDNKRFNRNTITSRPESSPEEEHDYCGNIPDVHHDSVENMQQDSYLPDSVDSPTSESQSEHVRKVVNDVVNASISYLGETEEEDETTNDVLERRNYPLNSINPLEEIPTLQINSHARNYTFASFICEELSNIEDDEILENAKWEIQTILRNASNKT